MYIENDYKQILQADKFVKNFNTLNDFKEWAMEGTISDLRACIKVFENYELYKHCAIMQKLIDDLI